MNTDAGKELEADDTNLEMGDSLNIGDGGRLNSSTGDLGGLRDVGNTSAHFIQRFSIFLPIKRMLGVA